MSSTDHPHPHPLIPILILVLTSHPAVASHSPCDPVSRIHCSIDPPLTSSPHILHPSTPSLASPPPLRSTIPSLPPVLIPPTSLTLAFLLRRMITSSGQLQ